MTPNADPAPIAYAVPTNDRGDARVRRVLGVTAIGLASLGLARTLYFVAIAVGLVPSSVYASAIRSPQQIAYEGSGLLLDGLLLAGGAMLIRSDAGPARTLIRIACVGRLSVIVALLVVSFATGSFPSSFSTGDRIYMVLSNSANLIGAYAVILAMTFAIPPRRIV